MTNPIDPNTISDGDPVVIQDADKNVARGIAEFDHEGQLILRAFGTDIVFGRWSNRARDGFGAYTTVKGIKIVGHEPPMELNVYDFVPKQKFRSNPT